MRQQQLRLAQPLSFLICLVSQSLAKVSQHSVHKTFCTQPRRKQRLGIDGAVGFRLFLA